MKPITRTELEQLRVEVLKMLTQEAHGGKLAFTPRNLTEFVIGLWEDLAEEYGWIVEV